jgi:hypothetical protein
LAQLICVAEIAKLFGEALRIQDTTAWLEREKKNILLFIEHFSFFLKEKKFLYRKKYFYYAVLKNFLEGVKILEIG